MTNKLTASSNKMNDGIASYVLKIVLPISKGSLCDLFTLSLFSEKFPDYRKRARVAPPPLSLRVVKGMTDLTIGLSLSYYLPCVFLRNFCTISFMIT